MLTRELLARLQSLWQEGYQLDHATTLRHEKRLNITPDTGQLLYQLVRHQRGGDILEIGTSNGYSTLWMALALRDLPGRIVTLDVSPEKQVLAQQNLQAFAVQDRVQLECRDAEASGWPKPRTTART
ncbi:O-methyltransferase [Paludibacterium denitrificans]|uniref:O-methyltransferase n=1 Tax=Paludibacterium denitrificans TaxID=2675226 RepID=UPI00247806DE|nr:class I SAM-dependent methyltransferase [Paludibacterium denitrificans]